MKWEYSVPSNNIWTSFDHGTVEANTYQEAQQKAIEQLKYDVRKCNEVLKSADITKDFEIEFEFEQVEITLITEE